MNISKRTACQEAKLLKILCLVPTATWATPHSSLIAPAPALLSLLPLLPLAPLREFGGTGVVPRNPRAGDRRAGGGRERRSRRPPRRAAAATPPRTSDEPAGRRIFLGPVNSKPGPKTISNFEMLKCWTWYTSKFQYVF